MVLNTVVQKCGDNVCVASETFENCPSDCTAQVVDYINCALDKGVCNIPWFEEYGGKILFIGFVFIILYFLKSKKFI